MDEKKLLQALKQTAVQGRTELDLSKKGIKRLLPQIGQLKRLTKLSLEGNELSTLPPEIGQLENLTVLFIGNNKLTKLPPQIGNLTNLNVLSVLNNQLSSLPPEIGNLENLTTLSLSNNRLTTLPREIGRLTNLVRLRLHKNQLSELPPEIGRLSKLVKLSLDDNRLFTLPPEIGRLHNLPELGLVNNRLFSLPSEIGRMRNLSELWLQENQLTTLPPELGKLTTLQVLELGENPLASPPPGIVQQGRQAVLAYLRGQMQASREQWVSKLLVVGEGGVGKTSLLEAIERKSFDPHLPSTHGIAIRTLDVPHPTERDVVMELKAWDFGGQEIYHATHQFFLTNRALFLLVWNTRHGYEQGKLYYWLDTIQAKAPDSPVVLVATHIDERDADLPFKDLRQKHPQIVGQCEISNKTGKGIEELQKTIAQAAAGLPLMGETWPAVWLDAAEAIRGRKEKYVASAELRRVMDSHKVSSDNARVLAQWLHELGDILFFQDDEELGDIVMLKPQWVSRYISMVLESEEVIKRLGVLTRAHRDALWKDIEPAMREHFLRLMERFDLSHRTLEDRDVSLIVERLPLDPPNYEEKWEAMLGSNNCQEIAMKYRLNTIQAGIPTWFIARSHRFTTQTHWRTGALFADTPQGTHLALVQAFPHDRYVSLVVRGPHPQNFFALLRDGLELTLKRFPGLKVHRLVPCPGHGGQPCGHEFRYEQLLNRLERPTAKYHIECPESYQEVDARDLLFGLAPRTFGAVHREIIRSVRGGGDSHVELIPLLQREFSKSHQREQARIESHCPSVFALRQIKTRRGRQSILQLYCEAPGCWHPVQSDDQYIVDQAVKWVRKQEPHLKQMAPLLRYVSLAAGPWTSLGPEEYERSVRYDIRFMLQLAKTLEETTAAGEMGVSEDGNGVIDRDRARVVALRALRQLLDEKDPERRWGGLRKVLTPEGHYLWLCEYHAKEYAH